MDKHYWARQDSNYNVLGLVDFNAALVERHELSARLTFAHEAGHKY